MKWCTSVILTVSIPLLLAALVPFVEAGSEVITRRGNPAVPLAGRKLALGGLGSGAGKSFAVVFDAGSSGSRVHVFCFDKNLDLVHIGNEVEVFEQLKPGLSAYASDPKEAAKSLVPLLEKAESTVPVELQPVTPVKVGATAGLRTLGDETAEKILQAVRNLLAKHSLKFQPDWVSILDGTQEGSYQWITINYLLETLGKQYSRTVGVVDLGGGSVQMAYAISKSDAAKAPEPAKGQEKYVKKLLLKGTTYYLYVHSYLHYGLLAARAEILKAEGGSYSNCILKGYHGTYNYGGEEFPASASPSGASFSLCRSDVVKALRVNAACTYKSCTFDGIWNGGGGEGEKNLYVASFFFDRAAEAGFVDSKLPVAEVRPLDFKKAAKRACKLSVAEAKTTYPRAYEDNLPYMCMDLTYEFSLLVDGFGLKPSQRITLVKKVQYGDALVEAAWPLGSAIEAVSLV